MHLNAINAKWKGLQMLIRLNFGCTPCFPALAATSNVCKLICQLLQLVVLHLLWTLRVTWLYIVEPYLVAFQLLELIFFGTVLGALLQFSMQCICLFLCTTACSSDSLDCLNIRKPKKNLSFNTNLSYVSLPHTSLRSLKVLRQLLLREEGAKDWGRELTEISCRSRVTALCLSLPLPDSSWHRQREIEQTRKGKGG